MKYTIKRYSYIVTHRRRANPDYDDCDPSGTPGPWISEQKAIRASDDETARRMLLNEYFSKGRQVRTIDEVGPA